MESGIHIMGRGNNKEQYETNEELRMDLNNVDGQIFNFNYISTQILFTL